MSPPLHEYLSESKYSKVNLFKKRAIPFCLCPQEVETEQYYTFFLENLKAHGYDGYFCPKSRAKLVSEQERKHVDGCAVFFKTQKWVCPLCCKNLGHENVIFESDLNKPNIGKVSLSTFLQVYSNSKTHCGVQSSGHGQLWGLGGHAEQSDDQRQHWSGCSAGG